MAVKQKLSSEKEDSNDEKWEKAITSSSSSLSAAADPNKDETKVEEDKYYLSDFAKAVIIEAMCKTPNMNNPPMMRTKSDEEDIAEFDDFVIPPKHKKRKMKRSKREADNQCSTSLQSSQPSTSHS